MVDIKKIVEEFGSAVYPDPTPVIEVGSYIQEDSLTEDEFEHLMSFARGDVDDIGISNEKLLSGGIKGFNEMLMEEGVIEEPIPEEDLKPYVNLSESYNRLALRVEAFLEDDEEEESA